MAKSITEILSSFLHESGLEQPILEDRLVAMWPEMMGLQVAKLTSKIEIRDGVLFVHIRSAALRQQLFECRFQLVQRLNQAVNGNVIRDIRILG